MYKYEDFKDNIKLKNLIDTTILAKQRFKDYHVVKRVDLIGYGDSWENIACIDKLVELGYIAVVQVNEFSNNTTCRNIRL